MKIKRPDSVTVADVATHAGVSVGTVSRVLNNKPNISPDNIARVQQAVAALGYQKCQSAGLLVSRRMGSRVRAGNIGMVFAEMSAAWTNHPFISAHTMGIEKACREKGFHAIIELSGDGSNLPRCITEGKIDGIIIKATRKIPAFVKDIPPGFPMVALSSIDHDATIHQVAADNQGAGWGVAQYLWQQGHRRIAFVSSESDHPIFIARQQGYESYLRQKQSFHPELVLMMDAPHKADDPEETPPNMLYAVEHLFSRDKTEWPTAVITANDWMACGFYASLKSKGLRIPEDISMVGLDNSPGICTTLSPALTSYDVCFDSIAYNAALALFDRILDPAKHREPSIQLVRGRLTERQSVQQIAVL